MNLEKMLRERRIECGLSQQRLADLAGVTKRAVTYWENGKRKMSVESADKIFKVLKMRIIIGDCEGQGGENNA